MGVLPACMCVHPVLAQPMEVRDGPGSPGTGATDGCWESRPGSLAQHVLLPAEVSPASHEFVHMPRILCLPPSKCFLLSLFSVPFLFSPFFKLVKVIWNTFFTVEDSKTNLYGKDVEFPSCVLQVSPLKTTVTCEDLWELKLQSHKHVYTSM